MFSKNKLLNLTLNMQDLHQEEVAVIVEDAAAVEEVVEDEVCILKWTQLNVP